MPAQTSKPRKPGRPKLAKGAAKGSIVPVRFNPEDRKRVEAAAKASNKTVSEWIRSTLAAAIGD
jgi:predicted HicB family RNase H-like nuclease